MSLTPEDVATVLAEHQARGTTCDCGWRTYVTWVGGPAFVPWPEVEADHRAHVAEQIAALVAVREAAAVQAVVERVEAVLDTWHSAALSDKAPNADWLHYCVRAALRQDQP